LVANTSIADVLALLGGPGLEDVTSDARGRFRTFLCQPKWSPEDLRAWIDECTELACRAHSEYYFALQDLIVSIGIHLGFEVEFGAYTSTDPGWPIPYDGRWRAITGEDILVEVKSSPWPLGCTNQLGNYMEEYRDGCPPQHPQVLGIYAIGTGDFSGLIDQIKGSDFRNRLKVVSFHDLLRLYSLRNTLAHQMPMERIYQVLQELMMPLESVNVGSLVDIIQGVAGVSWQSLEEDAPPEPTRRWRRSELREFLDECQPNQLAMLLALSTSQEPMSATELLRRMRVVAPSIPGIDARQGFSAKTIGGARSGLSKREQFLDKDSVIESFNGQYCLREDCRQWVYEWLKCRGMMPIPTELNLELDGLFAEAQCAGAAG
jgi:hypothetical protein